MGFILGVFLSAQPSPEPGDWAGIRTNVGDTKGMWQRDTCAPPSSRMVSIPKAGGFHGAGDLSRAGIGILSLPTVAVWKWAERKRAVKQTKALMQVASFPLRLQSLVKMLILEGSKRRLALIWTTLRDLRGGERAWDGIRHGMGHPEVSHSSRFALFPPFPSFSQEVEEDQTPSPSRAQGDPSRLGTATLHPNSFKGLSKR